MKKIIIENLNKFKIKTTENNIERVESHITVEMLDSYENGVDCSNDIFILIEDIIINKLEEFE